MTAGKLCQETKDEEVEGQRCSSLPIPAMCSSCQGRVLGAPGCSQSLNRRLTALRDSLPMGNSASSTLKAAWLTDRGTYRGPPTCITLAAQDPQSPAGHALVNFCHMSGSARQCRLACGPCNAPVHHVTAEMRRLQ